MPPGHGQAKARAAMIDSGRALLKRFKKAVMIRVGNVRSGIHHLKGVAVLCVRGYMQAHFTCLCKLYCVVQKIDQNLLQLGLIPTQYSPTPMSSSRWVSIARLSATSSAISALT